MVTLGARGLLYFVTRGSALAALALLGGTSRADDWRLGLDVIGPSLGASLGNLVGLGGLSSVGEPSSGRLELSERVGESTWLFQRATVGWRSQDDASSLSAGVTAGVRFGVLTTERVRIGLSLGLDARLDDARSEGSASHTEYASRAVSLVAGLTADVALTPDLDLRLGADLLSLGLGSQRSSTTDSETTSEYSAWGPSLGVGLRSSLGLGVRF